jgi:hypothetical protein
MFAITKNMGVLLSPDKTPAQPYLKLGTSSAAEQLQALKIAPSPLQLRYTEHMVACFDYYDEAYNIDQ